MSCLCSTACPVHHVLKELGDAMQGFHSRCSVLDALSPYILTTASEQRVAY